MSFSLGQFSEGDPPNSRLEDVYKPLDFSESAKEETGKLLTVQYVDLLLILFSCRLTDIPEFIFSVLQHH